MKIKTKLSFGIVFLFAEFLIVSLFSLYFIFKISQQNNLITKNNNLSIGYAENMIQSIDRINDYKASSIFNPRYLINEKEISGYLKQFETNLIDEENNITETGEKELAKSVRDNFEKIKILLTNSVENSINDKSGFYFTNLLPTVNEIKFLLFAISDANMNSIIRKNVIANETATHSYIVLSTIATICFIVFFAFIFSFPKYITKPIEILAKSIKETSNKNYESRVHFNTNDEFGEISKVYNDMVDKLKGYENIEIGKLLDEKHRAESIINTLDEPIIVLDEHQNITLVNFLAEKLLGLNRSDIINKKASDVATNNELLSFMIRELNQGKVKQAETFTQVVDDIKTMYASEMDIITAYNKNKDLITLGYKISVKKISKAFN
jgi:NtrC-family two-component system sensor histidine kinase KinB